MACPRADSRQRRSAFPGINRSRSSRTFARWRGGGRNGCQAGFCTDGTRPDWRTDEHGEFVDPHKIFSILLSWVLKRHNDWPEP